MRGEHTVGVEVRKGLTKSLDGSLLRLADPGTGVVELLVGLVFALRVADLALEVVVVLLLELPHAVPYCPLHSADKVSVSAFICRCPHVCQTYT